MVLPSRREGYGLVVSRRPRAVRRAWWSTAPTTRRPSSSSEGENGYVAPSASPEDLAAAIERVHADGPGAARANRGLVSRATRAALARHPRSRRSWRPTRAGSSSAVSLAVRSQVKRGRTLPAHSPAAAQDSASSAFDPAADVALGPPGRRAAAASPATSGSDERFAQTTGTPRTIASSTGSPKPS